MCYFCRLDDEIWDVRFHFDGNDNLERNIGRVDITFFNLLAMIEQEGFGWGDSMYYVREQGVGISGVALIQSIKDVEEMISIYEDVQCVLITVIKGEGGLPEGFNKSAYEDLVHVSDIGEEPVVYSIDGEGSLFDSQDSAMQYLPTQQSISQEEGKEIVHVDTGEEYLLTQQSYIPVILINSEEDDDLNERIINLKRKRKTMSEQKEDYFSKEEELYNDSDMESEDSDFIIEPEQFEKKEARNAGPTSRSHYEEGTSSIPDYVPSSDEGKDVFLSDDDDGFEAMNFVLPNGKKSRAKEMKGRIWYDEQRLQPEEQLCLKLCFVDVYQFRRVVQQLHIAQLRNYYLHRNCKDRVIAKCLEKGCPFFMVGSQVGSEKTFCLRKMHLEHTCGPVGEACKVSAKWVAKACEKAIRTDVTTKVDTIIENAKDKHGVFVPRTMA
jgi:hypothetical protein